jgi:hypothetical protein
MDSNMSEQHSAADYPFQKEEILSVLEGARAALTHDEILAVVTIRREQVVMSCLEELILKGECGAVLEKSQDGTPTWHDFAFWYLTDEERAERPWRHGSAAPIPSPSPSDPVPLRYHF